MTENLDETEPYVPDERDRALRTGRHEQLTAGDRVGPHRIVRVLGKGGMGEVYEGFDERLQRPVALKRIKPSSKKGEEVRERFRREALAVAKLRHSAVVQVYDWIEEPSGDSWIVMELVEGRSLRQILEPGPLRPGQAARWARDLVAGLAFAHQAGIVHRDLKAENVMITPVGEVKILDFGLAKHRDLPESGSLAGSPAATPSDLESEMDAAASGLTAVGQLVGTVSAMSPEQAMGDPVDHRSDLFAIGSLLYEMLTGRSPFKVKASLETLTRICTFRQPSVLDEEPDVPEELSELVDHLLEKNPDSRPQSAVEVVSVLDEVLAELPTTEDWSSISGYSTTSGVRGLPAPLGAGSGWGNDVSGRRSRVESEDAGVSIRTFALVAFGLVLVLNLLLVWRFGMDDTVTDEALPVAPVRVVILPFETLGEEPETFFAAGLVEELARRLTRVDGLALVSSTSAARLVAAGKTLKEVGETLECDFVVEGSVYWSAASDGDGKQVRVSPRLVRIEDESTIWNGLYDRMLDDLLGVQTDIARHVVEQLQPTLTPTDGPEPVTIPTESSRAYLAYLRGLEFAYRPSYHDSDMLEATKMFDRAVEVDPSFFEPWVELVQAYAKLYLNGYTAPECREEALRALRQAEALRPGSLEVRLARAHFLYRIEADYARAAEILEELESEQPHNAGVVGLLGYVQRRQGRFREAVVSLQRSFALDGANAELSSQISETYRAMREFDGAQRWYLTTLELAPAESWMTGQFALSLLYGSGCEPAVSCSMAEAREILVGGTDPTHLDLEFSSLLLGLYETPSGVTRAEHFETLLADLDIGPVPRWRRQMEEIWRQMWLERELGRPERARELAAAWKEVAEASLREGDEDSWAYALLGFTRVFLGDTQGAIEAANRAMALSMTDRYSGPRCREWSMIVRMLAGEHEEALEMLRDLMDTDYQLAMTRLHLRLDPFWDPVREKALFLSILER